MSEARDVLVRLEDDLCAAHARIDRLEAELRSWREHHALWECDCDGDGEHVPNPTQPIEPEEK